ncbi:MAG: Gfo/Idh/MocA family protein [Caulobacterales bacterium]
MPHRRQAIEGIVKALALRFLTGQGEHGGKMMKQLRAGVIGAGVFGRHHARKLAADPRVVFVGVYDRFADRAESAAAEVGGTPFSELESMLNKVDVVTVASPPETHAGLTLAALRAGKHVLVEKPLAARETEGAQLVAEAKARNLVLACGHQERLVFDAMGVFDLPERPTRIEARRAGPWTGRSADVSVTLDLMVHDMDLALALMGDHPIDVSATPHAAREGLVDDLSVSARFANGARVDLSASRISDARARTMKIVYPSGVVEIDFVARTFVNTTGFALNADFALDPRGRDPLGANVHAFLDAVTGETARPPVTGAEGLAALRFALAADRACFAFAA